MTTLTSREFNQDAGKAKRMARLEASRPTS
jgi:hypothetical protein